MNLSNIKTEKNFYDPLTSTKYAKAEATAEILFKSAGGGGGRHRNGPPRGKFLRRLLIFKTHETPRSQDEGLGDPVTSARLPPPKWWRGTGAAGWAAAGKEAAGGAVATKAALPRRRALQLPDSGFPDCGLWGALAGVAALDGGRGGRPAVLRPSRGDALGPPPAGSSRDLGDRTRREDRAGNPTSQFQAYGQVGRGPRPARWREAQKNDFPFIHSTNT